ncbi:VOC family protein [Paractinoplanes ferrugineus]|uniref:VOC family protein n=1 Tax=Paractinoplanes ferrugineus TaxID=113564 RepID=UPI001EF22168|nr:VOC family protein [Actinoplanes ferrugineus]
MSTPDPSRTAGFYADLFGWAIDGDQFRLEGRAVAGIVPSRPDQPTGWLTYLAAPDLDYTIRCVEAAYGHVLIRPEERPGGRRAVVADSSGAIFGLWQAAGFAGAQLRGEPGTMAWSDLLTDNASRATAFYGSVFGWSLTHEFGSGEWLTEARDSVAGLIPGRYDVRWQPSFQVADCPELVAHVARLGGRVTAGPVEMGLGRYAEIIDPAGTQFAITAPLPRPVELAVAYNDIIGLELTYGG